MSKFLCDETIGRCASNVIPMRRARVHGDVAAVYTERLRELEHAAGMLGGTFAAINFKALGAAQRDVALKRVIDLAKQIEKCAKNLSEVRHG